MEAIYSWTDQRMNNIFDTEFNEQYIADFDENDDLVFSTGIIDDSNPDPNYARAGRNRKNVSVKLDDLDWGMFPTPEILKINEFYEIAANAGAQKREIPAGTIGTMRLYLKNMITQ